MQLHPVERTSLLRGEIGEDETGEISSPTGAIAAILRSRWCPRLRREASPQTGLAVSRLQRGQEREHCVPITRRQPGELLAARAGFAAMPADRTGNGGGSAVVQQESAVRQAPERSGPPLPPPAPGRPPGWRARRRISASGIASISPAPNTGVVARRYTTFASGGTTSPRTVAVGANFRSDRAWRRIPPFSTSG